jgi:hypothetical protein
MNNSIPGMIGTQVQYVLARPYGFAPIVATGTITEVAETRYGTQIRVKPDAPHQLTKWRSITDIQTYIWQLSAPAVQ